MRVLFTSEATLAECGGIYYSNNLKPQIERYSYFGRVTCLCYRTVVKTTKMHQLDRESADYVFANKENTLKSIIKDKKINDEIIRKQVETCDMLIAHVPSNNSYHAVKWAKKYNKPYFLVVVGCAWDALWNYDRKGRFIAPFAFHRLRKTVGQSKFALYVTESFLQNRYPCKGVTEHASNVCISGCGEELLNERLLRINEYKKNCTFNLVTSAKIDVRYKGQEYVIRAISELNKLGLADFHYYLIGAGDKTYLSMVAEKYGVTSNVHFLGSMSHSDVIKTLDSMDLYIQPSKQEGLPRALIEGMSRCLPSIGTNVAGIPELLPKDFLVRKGSVKDIVNVISAHFDKETLSNQAIVNQKKSLEYTIEELNKRRKQFFDKFLMENQLTINE